MAKKECVIRATGKSFIAFIALVWQAQQPKPFLGAKAPLILAHVKKNSRTKKFKIAYLHIWC